MNEGCACISVCPEYESSTIVQKMRKEQRGRHKCGECGRRIEKEEEYEWHFGDDGYNDLYVHITCADCLSIRDALFCDGWFWGRIWQDVWDFLCDMDDYGETSSVLSCVPNLTPRARDMLFEDIETLWKEWNDDDDEDDAEEADGGTGQT